MELYGAKMEILETKVAALEGSKIVVDVDPDSVPDITPVLAFMLPPPGKLPDTLE